MNNDDLGEDPFAGPDGMPYFRAAVAIGWVNLALTLVVVIRGLVLGFS